MNNVHIAGVGMVPFKKPGQSDPYRVMAGSAIRFALEDAGLPGDTIQQAIASYIYGETGSGQHSIYDVLQNGMPIINVNNACASGSSALFLARQAVLSGLADCVLAVGFDEMPRGAIAFDSRVEYVGDRIDRVLDDQGYAPSEVMTPRWFGAAGQQYLEKYDASPQLFADIAVKSRQHAAASPYAIFREPITREQVMESPLVWGNYLTRLMACPPSCGAAAAVLVSDNFAREHKLSRLVSIRGQGLVTDTAESWSDALNACGAGNTRRAAMKALGEAGVDIDDIDVVELHDCFTPNEAISYEGLGLCEPGGATDFVGRGDNTFGGKYVVNPSGGLMSKGHPIGATGVAQCCELVTQLRGEAGLRQVSGARLALQHNIGLVGAAAVTVYGVPGDE